MPAATAASTAASAADDACCCRFAVSTTFPFCQHPCQRISKNKAQFCHVQSDSLRFAIQASEKPCSYLMLTSIILLLSNPSLHKILLRTKKNSKKALSNLMFHSSLKKFRCTPEIKTGAILIPNFYPKEILLLHLFYRRLILDLRRNITFKCSPFPWQRRNRVNATKR